jgi:hypothetical protein
MVVYQKMAFFIFAKFLETHFFFEKKLRFIRKLPTNIIILKVIPLMLTSDQDESNSHHHNDGLSSYIGRLALICENWSHKLVSLLLLMRLQHSIGTEASMYICLLQRLPLSNPIMRQFEKKNVPPKLFFLTLF